MIILMSATIEWLAEKYPEKLQQLIEKYNDKGVEIKETHTILTNK